MTFPTTPIIDNFNRGAEGPPPSANWVTFLSENGAAVAGNQCVNDGSTTFCGAMWNAATFGPDCEVYLTLTNLDTGYYGSLYVRLSSNDFINPIDYYGFVLSYDSGSNYFWKLIRQSISSGYLQLSSGTITLATGDSIGLSAVGSTITAYHKPVAGSWTVVDTQTNGDVTAVGYIGFDFAPDVASTVAIDDFGGGTISSAAPVADFSADVTTGAAPLTVTFTDASTNTPTSWAWDFGDGNTSTDQNPINVYSSVGTYTVALTATNADGSDTETKVDYITVFGAPVADFSGVPTSGGVALSVAFTDASTNAPTSWLWDFGDGGSSTSQNPTYIYNYIGVYTVTLTATNSAGSDAETKIAYITVTAVVEYGPATVENCDIDTGGAAVGLRVSDVAIARDNRLGSVVIDASAELRVKDNSYTSVISATQGMLEMWTIDEASSIVLWAATNGAPGSTITWNTIALPTNFVTSGFTAQFTSALQTDHLGHYCYVSGKDSGNGNRLTVWQLDNLAAIRATPATSPSWSVIAYEGQAVSVGTLDVQNLFYLRAFGDSLFLHAVDGTKNILGEYNGTTSTWTWRVAIGQNASYQPVNGGVHACIDLIGHNSYLRDWATDSQIGATFLSKFGIDHFSEIWRRFDVLNHLHFPLAKADSRCYIHEAVTSTEIDIDNAAGNTEDSATMRGAWTSDQVYCVSPTAGNLHYSVDGLTFNIIATWASGWVMNTALDGSGNLIWFKKAQTDTNPVVRLYDSGGTLLSDFTGDLWTVLGHPGVGRNFGNLLIVYADVVGGTSVINPLAGDRAVWDALNYPERHTDDTDSATGIHHTQESLNETYQPLAEILTTLSELADAAGALTNDGAGVLSWDATIGGSTGSTDNAVLRADGTGGATLQSSLAVIDDSGGMNIPTGQEYKINNVQHAHVEADLFLSDVTTADATITAHGFLPKLPGDAGKYLGGDGTFHDIPTTLSFFLDNAASDLAGYKTLIPTVPTGGEVNVSASITGAAVAIEEWALAANQFDFISTQVLHVHLHAAKTAGVKGVNVFVRVYHRTSGGTETLLGTSENTPAITTKTDYDLHVAISDTAFSDTDRLVIKFLGNQTGSGTDPTVAIYFQGTTLSRIEIGAAPITSGGGHVVQDEGTPLTQRANLNFVGAGVTATDDAGNDATVITIPGGAGIGGSTGSTDNAILRADGTGGATLQASLAEIDDGGTVNIPTGQLYKINNVQHTHTEADLSLSGSNTTNDVSLTAHGFAPQATGDTDKFLRADGSYQTVSGAGGGWDDIKATAYGLMFSS